MTETQTHWNMKLSACMDELCNWLHSPHPGQDHRQITLKEMNEHIYLLDRKLILSSLLYSNMQYAITTIFSFTSTLQQ